MCSILMKEQTEKEKVIVNSYMDKTCTKPHSITIPDINVRTQNHTIFLYREASDCHIQTTESLKLKKYLLPNYTASHPER